MGVYGEDGLDRLDKDGLDSFEEDCSDRFIKDGSDRFTNNGSECNNGLDCLAKDGSEWINDLVDG